MQRFLSALKPLHISMPLSMPFPFSVLFCLWGHSQRHPVGPKRANRGDIPLMKTSYCKAGCDYVRAPAPAQSRPKFSQITLFSPINLLSLPTQLPSSLPQGWCQLGPNTSAYLHATDAWNRSSSHRRHRQTLDFVGCHHICCSGFSWGRLRAYWPLTPAGISDHIVAV